MNSFQIGAVCNKSQEVLEAVTLTNSKVTDLDGNATQAADDVETFSEDAKDLLDKVCLCR